MFHTETPSGEKCFYKSSSEVAVLPIKITNTKFSALPFKSPKLPEPLLKKATVQSLLTFKISPAGTCRHFEISDDVIRFYLNEPININFKLHEFLLNKAMGIVIARDFNDQDPIVLDSTNLKACGFSEDEATLEFDGRASSAHRLLIEYFLTPNKFLFVDLLGVSEVWQKYPEGFSVYIYFDETNIDLVRGVDDRSLLLGAGPVVNLFDATIQPIQASELGDKVPLRVADAAAKYADIYRIKEVYALNPRGDRKEIRPFYGHHSSTHNDPIYWSIDRQNSAWKNGRVSHGTDAFLSIVDSDYQLVSPDSDWLINAKVVSTNRDLPSQLAFGPEQPNIKFMQGGAGIRVKCLTPPTHTIQPKLDTATRWQLISQLSLQHFSDDKGLETLKQTLHLYNITESKEVFSLIDGITSLETSVKTARVMNQGRSAICQGTRFTLTCDESLYIGNSLFLFGLIMDEFFSQFCSINTFTELSIKTTKSNRVKFKWPARVGSQPLV
jgi:type VI secretion system protein ImpG